MDFNYFKELVNNLPDTISEVSIKTNKKRYVKDFKIIYAGHNRLYALFTKSSKADEMKVRNKC